ncbi:MAG: acetoacetate decarboxylase family protein [Caldilineaceae bacterium]
MPYPPAPWHLQGEAVQTLQLIEIDRARPLIPPSVSILPILPGRTLGGVYFAHYGSGSILEYHELIVAAALTRVDKQIGYWISHIYVDQPASMQGGRAIWGLPKTLAEFHWAFAETGEISVQQAGQLLCTLRYSRPRNCLPMPLVLPTISQLEDNLLHFRGQGQGCLGWGQGRLDAPDDSPLAGLDLTRSGHTFHLRNMRLLVNAPRPIRESIASNQV